MNKKLFPLHIPLVGLLFLLLASCHSIRISNMTFANLEWKMNDSTKYIHDKSLNWVFTTNKYDFSNLDPILGDEIAISRYDGMRNYLNQILSIIPFDIDTVLAYIPTRQLIFATYKKSKEDIPPTTYVVLNSEKDHVALNLFGDPIPEEKEYVYCNLFFNNKRKQCAMVYRFPYNDRTLLMIQVLQGSNKEADKLSKIFENTFPSPYMMTRPWIDPSDQSLIEPVGWIIKDARINAVKNYNLGKRLKELKQQK
ncbi:MAG: hypothetical protein K2J82_02550 [Muribaculaceae bacterium]|nr:hypothetical protein [Muribaculaceae bacterium]MDE6753471.1 hypothetical protein [Muribaculaceae bacterium]